jgi:hypothetical protein
MTEQMTSYPEDSTVDDLLHLLSERFLLDERIAGNRLGDLLAETIRDAGHLPLLLCREDGSVESLDATECRSR